MKGNEKMEKKTGEGYNDDQMEANMKDIGKKIMQVDWEDYFMLVGINMKASGIMIRQMGMEFITIQMELCMQDLELMINNKELDEKHEVMELSIQVSFKKEKNMELGN